MRQTRGFTIVELLFTTLIFAVVLTGLYAALLSGQSAWSTTDTQIRLQQGLRGTLQRVAAELQESGSNGAGTMQVTINDNAGTNSSDILKFSIPLCVCSNTPIDVNGDVANWGAPLNWGKTNCPSDTTLNATGKINICHLPPENPNNKQNLEIAASDLNAHLSHGDWLENCTSCSVTNNKYIEYSINAGNKLLRKVLDNANTVVKTETIAENVADLQAVFSANQNIITVTVTALLNTAQKRQIGVSRSLNIHLRNRG